MTSDAARQSLQPITDQQLVTYSSGELVSGPVKDSQRGIPKTIKVNVLLYKCAFVHIMDVALRLHIRAPPVPVEDGS
jgi:hypothetical protein